MAGYAIAAHETTYNGVRFRSRLEATWAAFFDLGGWSWSYEPIDFVGWSPDFEISHPEHLPDPVYVEVKPTWGMALDRAEGIARVYHHPFMLLASGPGTAGSDWGDFTGSARCFGKKEGPELGVLVDEDGMHSLLVRENLEGAWREASNLTRWKAA